MNEKEFENVLLESLSLTDADPESVGFDSKMEGFISDLSTFEDAGVMTMNKGLVVRLADGSEFQVTIVQSQRARE